nr:BTAD domain-containing putative transcriptional regulator [uncultured Blautia sp.]
MEPVRINLMGTFQISSGDVTLREKDIRSVRGIKLLTFLVLNRKRIVTIQELEEFLIRQETEGNFENADGYVKNLVYRVRKILKAIGPYPYITTGYKNYAWNPEIPVIVDVEIFKQQYENARNCPDLEQKKILYKELLYSWRPLTGVLTDEYWMMGIDTYYTSVFLEAVKNLAGILEKENKYKELVQLCRYAMPVEPLDEDIRFWLIKTLILQKKTGEALKEWGNARRVWKKQLQGYFPERLNSLYKDIISSSISNEPDPMKILRSLMKFAREKQGGRYCAQEIFEQLCLFLIGRNKGSENEEYLILFTLVTGDLEKQEKKQGFTLRNGRNKFVDILLKDLEHGDVFTELGTRQFAVLPVECSEKKCEQTAGRLIEKFEKSYPGGNIDISYKIINLFEDAQS